MSKTWSSAYYSHRKRRPKRRKCARCGGKWAMRDAVICHKCKVEIAVLAERIK